MLAVFRSKRMFVLFALGYAGGLPLYLTGQTLQSWMTDAHVDLKEIAAFNAVGLAYTLKFLWAPLLDRFRLPLLGRRRARARHLAQQARAPAQGRLITRDVVQIRKIPGTRSKSATYSSGCPGTCAFGQRPQ